MVTAIGENLWRRWTKSARRLDTRRLAAMSPMLVLSPHADDETLGCGGLITTVRDIGLELKVAYLTDGAASHPGSRAWPAPRLAEVRRTEALAALQVLGLDERQVMFLNWPDAAPIARGEAGYHLALQRLVEWCPARPFRSIWAPWPGETHCDHAAAAELADDLAAALATAPIRMDFLVWAWAQPELEHTALGQVRALHCPNTTARRRAALARHRTQTTDLITDASDGGFLIPAGLAALIERPIEVYLEHP